MVQADICLLAEARLRIFSLLCFVVEADSFVPSISLQLSDSFVSSLARLDLCKGVLIQTAPLLVSLSSSSPDKRHLLLLLRSPWHPLSKLSPATLLNFSLAQNLRLLQTHSKRSRHESSAAYLSRWIFRAYQEPERESLYWRMFKREI